MEPRNEKKEPKTTPARKPVRFSGQTSSVRRTGGWPTTCISLP